MNARVILGILLALGLVAGAAGIGVYAYNAGVAQGLAQSDKVELVAPYGRYYGGPFFYGPFGWGFGLLGCLFPLLFLFLIFGLARAMFWRGPWGWGRHKWGHGGPGGGPGGGWEKGVPPMFEEWHRRAHEPGADQTQAPPGRA